MLFSGGKYTEFAADFVLLHLNLFYIKYKGIYRKKMALPKFIVCMDGTFRLGMVNQHRHLLKPGDQCIGGYYHFDFVSNRITLDRESYDFGRPRWHLLEVLRVPSAYRGMRIVYKYDDDFHDDYNVSEELRIEYYD